MNPLDIETMELLPGAERPQQLFVLLHDAGGEASDMLALGNHLADAFPQAAVLLPQGLAGPASDTDDADADALAARVQVLADFLRAQQQRLGALPCATALAGFGAGATLALALVNAHDGLGGRVLAFGGCYATLPAVASELTTLHLLHGQNDAVVPVERIRFDYGHLMALGADATLDVASAVGHELHPALMDQAVTRLQTCVPLRFWKAL
ncbi:MAG: esterase [Polaromonas sp.]